MPVLCCSGNLGESPVSSETSSLAGRIIGESIVVHHSHILMPGETSGVVVNVWALRMGQILLAHLVPSSHIL
jgi:hypothetical protein